MPWPQVISVLNDWLQVLEWKWIVLYIWYMDIWIFIYILSACISLDPTKSNTWHLKCLWHCELFWGNWEMQKSWKTIQRLFELPQDSKLNHLYKSLCSTYDCVYIEVFLCVVCFFLHFSIITGLTFHQAKSEVWSCYRRFNWLTMAVLNNSTTQRANFPISFHDMEKIGQQCDVPGWRN